MALPPGALGGLWAPVRAAGFLLKHPRLWWLAATPFLINLGLFALAFWLGYTYFTAWLDRMIPVGQGWWWQALVYLIMFVAVLLLLIVQVYLFAVVGRIVAAPFLDPLTRRTEIIANPGAEPPPEMGFAQSIWRALIQESKRLALYIITMGLLLLVNLLPGIGSLIYGALAWVVTCFFLAGEFLDYPLERRGWSLTAKMGYTRRLGLTGLAFGLSVFALGVIPVLNLALLPLAAVGGTLLYLERPPIASAPGASAPKAGR